MSATDDYAIWLYGSEARGEADDASDVDLLLLGEVPSSQLALLRDRYPHSLSLSRYTWEEISAMSSYGSVFLHHVGREGVALIEHGTKAEAFRETLDHLPPYRYASRDLMSFRRTVVDVRASMSAGGSASYELSVLATTIRHAAILGCYVERRITFGRSEAVARVVDAWSLEATWSQRFDTLYGFALHDQRSENAPWASNACDTAEWADFADQLLDRLEVSIENFESNMSTAA